MVKLVDVEEERSPLLDLLGLTSERDLVELRDQQRSEQRRVLLAEGTGGELAEEDVARDPSPRESRA